MTSKKGKEVAHLASLVNHDLASLMSSGTRFLWSTLLTALHFAFRLGEALGNLGIMQYNAIGIAFVSCEWFLSSSKS